MLIGVPVDEKRRNDFLAALSDSNEAIGEVAKSLKLDAFKFEGDEGTVKAAFAQLDIVDHDGDIVQSGAVGQQKVLLSAYNHESWWSTLPVGKGVTYEEDGWAMVEAKFFLGTSLGRDHYETIKAVGDLQEWSFGLPHTETEQLSVQEVLDRFGEDAFSKTTSKRTTITLIKKVTIPEVSPVIMGAGIDTHTVAIKKRSEDAPKRQTLNDEMETACKHLEELFARIEAIKIMRESKGEYLGAATIEKLNTLAQELKQYEALAIAVVNSAPPDIAKEFMRFQSSIL